MVTTQITRIEAIGNALKKVPAEVKETVVTFIESIPNIKFLQPDYKPKPEWLLFTGKSLEDAITNAKSKTDGELNNTLYREMDDVAQKEAYLTGRAEARDVGSCGASWTPRYAARSEANNAVWNAVIITKIDGVPEHVARIVMFDLNLEHEAGLMAGLLLVKDRPKIEEFLAKEKARWEVTEKGYVLVGQKADGTLVVAAIEEPEKVLLRPYQTA